jgi:triosephosphate isomerase
MLISKDMRKFVAANFKMNRPDLKKWSGFKPGSGTEVVVFPSFLHIPAFAGRKNIILGAQDVFWENLRSGGAYTGEISADMLKGFGVKYALVGHSERRALGDTNEIVNKKLKTALSAGLKVVLCVGEGEDVRKKGLSSAKNFVRVELKSAFYGVKKKFLEDIIVAYEPIWAIGTGRTDKPSDAGEMADFIRSLLSASPAGGSVRVIYGGSVTSKNAAKFIGREDIDGALVGGASLDPKEFARIIAAGSSRS